MATIKTVVTDVAKKRISEMLLTGRGFQVKTFEVGEGGHDPLDINIALTPDPTVLELPKKTFGPKAVSDIKVKGFFDLEVSVFLDVNEAVGVVSNISVIAEITSSPIPGDPEMGTTFLLGVANLPHRAKLDSERIRYDLTLVY